MNRIALLVIFAALFVVAVPLAVWAKMDHDARAVSGPTDERKAIFEVVDLLARPTGSGASTELDRRRVVSLLEQLAKGYGITPIEAASGFVDIRAQLAQVGVDQPCIPVMEAMNLAADRRSTKNELALRLSVYATERKAGRGHDKAVEIAAH